jgi:hypothetical protein
MRPGRSKPSAFPLPLADLVPQPARHRVRLGRAVATAGAQIYARVPEIIRHDPCSLPGQSENFTARAVEMAEPFAFVGLVSGGQYCSLDGNAEPVSRR